MTKRLTCNNCGAFNASDAEFCGQCFHPPAGIVAVAARPAGAGPMAAPPPPPPRPAVDLKAALRDPGPVHPATFSPPASARPPLRWKWRHLWLFGLFAWGIPMLLTAGLSPGTTWSDLLSVTLLIQILGYVLAIGVAVFLVKRTQDGDWASLGITKSPDTPMELVKGFGYGLLLLGVWSAIAYALSGGEMEMDGLVTTLIGDTSELGLLLAAIVLVIGAPVIEEIYYRGMLYEKFARRSRWLAVIGTSILFVAAHGAIIIPALMVLAVGLGLARGKRPLWFTIGAHAGWNFAIVIIAAQIVFGPAGMFSPSDNAYTLRLPTGWQQIDAEEVPAAPGGTIDLVLSTGSGAAMSIINAEVPPGYSPKNIRKNMPLLESVMPMGATISQLEPSDLVFEGYPSVYELGMQVPLIDGLSAEATMVMALPRNPDHAYIFMLICPSNSCEANETEFDTMLRSVDFTS